MRLDLDGVFLTDAGDQKVILDVHNSSYLTANAAGRVILDCLLSDVSATRLSERLIDEFGIAKDEAERDCGAFLRELDSRGWLIAGNHEAVEWFTPTVT